MQFPNYFTGYQPAGTQIPQYNPYPQLLQANSAPLRVLPGRLVNTPEEIMANEVAMDGNVSLFPKNDYSCIYAKQWQSDGTIKTVRYVPETVEQPTKRLELDALINQRFDRLESLMSKEANND